MVDRYVGLCCCGDHVLSATATRERDHAVWIQLEHLPIPDRAGAFAVQVPASRATGQLDAHIDCPFTGVPIRAGTALALDDLRYTAFDVDEAQHVVNVFAVGVVPAAADDYADWHGGLYRFADLGGDAKDRKASGVAVVLVLLAESLK